MGAVKGYPRGLLDQACCIGLIGKNVIIDCETRAEAEEVLDWLCDGRAAETTAQAEIEALRAALEAAANALAWAERRMACKDYAEVIANDERNACAALGSDRNE